ncbi:MAG: hypothetical protein Q9160_002624 [Pyrenula sp. 1 TL-2023]
MLPGLFSTPARRKTLLHIRFRCGSPIASFRYVHQDGRARLSSLWLPTGGLAQKSQKENVDGKEHAHELLIRAGYLRQSQSGIFHFLPLGLRVQEKIERLIDTQMRELEASKLSLASISSQRLWKESNRLGSAQELFTFSDRRGIGLLLSPTHEEEITSLVASTVDSYKALPLRLYQISRKYRDEARPRAGLLRAREFLMKDLYTFDVDATKALGTYEAVREAYDRFFTDLKIPFVVAAADSGNMGGKVSHEYHLISPHGEDTLISCQSCGFRQNEDFMEDKQYLLTQLGHRQENTMLNALREYLERSNTYDDLHTDKMSAGRAGIEAPNDNIVCWQGITKDRTDLVEAFCQGDTDSDGSGRQINPYAVKSAFPVLDLGCGHPLNVLKNATLDEGKGTDDRNAAVSRHAILERENAADEDNVEVLTRTNPGERNGVDDGNVEMPKQRTVYYLFDHKIPQSKVDSILEIRAAIADSLGLNRVQISVKTRASRLDLKMARDGDTCPACAKETLQLQKAVELGHTFLLGTKYSDALNATVAVPPGLEKYGGRDRVPLQMGCHGIGISRTIAAVASHLSDYEGLRWPSTIAPFQCLIIPGNGCEEAAESVYDHLTRSGQHSEGSRPQIDAVLDDRDKSIVWKLNDGVLIGIPVLIIVGRSWKEKKKLEVQCRPLGIRGVEVYIEDILAKVDSLLNQL